MTEPIDTMAPWTIKSAPTRTRDAVTAAARRENVTVGQWLEKRVDEWLRNGGPVPVAGGSGVAELVELADAAARLAAAPDSALVRAARRALAAALRGVRPAPASAPRLLAAPAPNHLWP